MSLKLARRIFVILIIVIAQSFLLLSCAKTSEIDLTSSKPENMGNTIGNLYNSGLVTYDNNNIYYTTSSDSQIYLKKMNLNGEHQVLINKLCLYVNVINDFLYYVDIDDGAIYRMNIDGTQNKQLCDIKADFLFVINDTVLVLGGESNRYAGNLYTMGIDGTDVKKLTSDRVSQAYYYNDRIYYTTYSDGSILYRIDMDGENKQLIMQDAEIEKLFYIYNNNIFYLTNLGSIRKFDIDTNEDSLVYEKYQYIRTNCINAVDNTIFFQSTRAPRTYTYLNLDTDEVETSTYNVSNDMGMYTVGNKVFYYIGDKPYTMNIDGSKKGRLVESENLING